MPRFVAVITFALALALLASVRLAAALDGAALFAANCGSCHGGSAETPAIDIAGHPRGDITAALREIEEMRDLRLSPDTLDAIATYVVSLPPQ